MDIIRADIIREATLHAHGKSAEQVAAAVIEALDHIEATLDKHSPRPANWIELARLNGHPGT